MGVITTNLFTSLINDPPSISSIPQSPSHSHPPNLGLDVQQPPHPLPGRARVLNLFSRLRFIGLSAARCTRYQDIQLFVLMAGKVELSLLDSHRPRRGGNNGLGPFPAAPARGCKGFSCAVAVPHILWPDPALS